MDLMRGYDWSNLEGGVLVIKVDIYFGVVSVDQY